MKGYNMLKGVGERCCYLALGLGVGFLSGGLYTTGKLESIVNERVSVESSKVQSTLYEQNVENGDKVERGVNEFLKRLCQKGIDVDEDGVVEYKQ